MTSNHDLEIIKRAIVELAVTAYPSLDPASAFHRSDREQGRLQQRVPALRQLAAEHFAGPPVETRRAAS